MSSSRSDLPGIGHLREQARVAAAKAVDKWSTNARDGADAASDVWEKAWNRSVDTCDLDLFVEVDRLRALLHDIAVARRGDSPDVDEAWDRLPDEIEMMWAAMADPSATDETARPV